MSVCHGCGKTIQQPRLPQGGGRTRKWCSERCRKQTLYSVPCVDCGAPLNGSDGRGANAPVRCRKCASIFAGQEREFWTCERIIEAFREWHALYGRVPRVTEWNPTIARHRGYLEHAALYLAERDRWPHVNTVMRKFGSWRAGVEAAGFAPREQGEKLAA